MLVGRDGSNFSIMSIGEAPALGIQNAAPAAFELDNLFDLNYMGLEAQAQMPTVDAQVPFGANVPGFSQAEIALLNDALAGLPTLPDVPVVKKESGTSSEGWENEEEFLRQGTTKRGTRGRGRKTAEEKTAALQEKNRRAQKRFRERQKAKMSGMNEQLEEMTSQIDRLRLQNNSLKSRNGVLEQVLSVKDEHIRSLQEEKMVFDLGRQLLTERARVTGAPQFMGGAPKALGAPNGTSCAAECNSLICKPLNFPADTEAIRNMPAQSVIDGWKTCVRELSDILIDVEGSEPNTPKHDQHVAAMRQVLDRMGMLCMSTAVLHPLNMQKLIAANLDDGRSGLSANDSSRWAAITAALNLSIEQKTQIITLREIFVRKMDRVMEQRKTIINTLQTVPIPGELSGLQSVFQETLKVNDAAKDLKANLQEEHLAGLEFIGTVMKCILSPLQKARVAVRSYPFYPDLYQIATALTEEESLPNSSESGSADAFIV